MLGLGKRCEFGGTCWGRAGVEARAAQRPAAVAVRRVDGWAGGR